MQRSIVFEGVMSSLSTLTVNCALLDLIMQLVE